MVLKILKIPLIIFVIMCLLILLFSPTVLLKEDELRSGDLMTNAFKKLNRTWIETFASLEAVRSCERLRQSEESYRAQHGRFVPDGDLSGQYFTELDINPNQSTYRRWDYEVKVDDSRSRFAVYARRRTGVLDNQQVVLTGEGDWRGNYSFWFFELFIRDRP